MSLEALVVTSAFLGTYAVLIVATKFVSREVPPMLRKELWVGSMSVGLFFSFWTSVLLLETYLEKGNVERDSSVGAVQIQCSETQQENDRTADPGCEDSTSQFSAVESQAQTNETLAGQSLMAH